MKKLLIPFAMAALAAPAFAQSAAPQRVAVIDVQRVLSTSAAGKTAQERLKKLQEDKMTRAAKIQEEMKALDTEINTKKLSLSDDKLTGLQKQLAEKQLNLQRYGQDADRELGEARDKALLELEAKIKPVIDQIGKEMGLAAIFNKFESGLVYASEAIDITDSVIKRFNDATQSASAPATEPPAAKKQ
jgi:outer membrane protein